MSREALQLPGGFCITGGFSHWVLGFRKINCVGSSSRKREESDRGFCHRLVDVYPASLHESNPSGTSEAHIFNLFLMSVEFQKQGYKCVRRVYFSGCCLFLLSD